MCSQQASSNRLACCRHGNNVLRARDITLVGTTSQPMKTRTEITVCKDVLHLFLIVYPPL